MIYSRLMLARELLRDDGVIFVSIDDHEQANLKLLMDNVFGEDNFVSIFVWKKTENIKMDSKFISNNKDYVLCYIKGGLPEFLKEHSDEKRYNLIDEKSKYYLRKLDSKSSSYSRSLDYIIEHDGIKYYAGGNYEDYLSRQKFGANKKDCIWLWSRNTFNKGLNENEIVFKNGNVYNKVRFDGIAKKPFVDLLNVQSGQSAQEDFNNLFDGKRIFDHPKPVDLVYQLITMVSDENEDDLILDFFAGSGTTAHAVMQLNAEDGGNRKFICVQLPEPTDQKSEAYKAGYKTISQITAERIKRAGTKIAKEREEKPKEIFETEEQKLDTGFKFYKLTNTHFKIWHTEIQPTEIETVLDIFQDATVDTNSEEMLYELMLKLGYELTTKIEKTSQNFYYIPGYESCFALDNFENETILEIAKRNPRAIYTLNNFFEKDAELSCLRLGF